MPPSLHKITAKESSDTGMAMVLICLLVFWFTDNVTFVGVATGLLVLNMVWATLFKPVAWVWLGLSHLLGSVMSRIILSAVFFIVLTPLALLRRVFGHDPMALRQWKKNTASVFVERGQTYTNKDIEQPF